MNNLAAHYGYYSGQWRKGGLPRSISGKLTGIVENLNASAGTNSLVEDAVPSGVIWVVTALSSVNVNTNPTVIRISMADGTTGIQLGYVANPGVNIPLVVTGEFFLFPGMVLASTIQGCALNDDIRLTYSGFYMDILD